LLVFLLLSEVEFLTSYINFFKKIQINFIYPNYY